MTRPTSRACGAGDRVLDYSGDMRIKIAAILLTAAQPVPDGPEQPAWDEVGPGAWFAGKAEPGGTLFIGYAGYGADGPVARNWVSAVAAARGWGMAVAAEFMALLEKLGRKDLLKKLSYYDVDGGPCAPCRKYAADPANAGFLFRCVSAAQPGGSSAPNMDSMKTCGKYYTGLKAEGAGCSGAWCLHGWLINRAAAALDPVKPRTGDYYRSLSIAPCTAYFEDK